MKLLARLFLLGLGTHAFAPPRLDHNLLPQQRQQQRQTSKRRGKGRDTALRSIPNALDVLTSGLATIARLNRGVTVDPKVLAAASSANSSLVVLKELYDVENNPASRRVRERITELDLCVETVIPCAKASRARQALGKGAILPRLVAETATSSGKQETVVIEGDDEIIAFLNKQISGVNDSSVDGGGDSSWQGSLLELVDVFGGIGAGLLRAGRGMRVSPAVGPRPEQPVVLYDYAGNQFCRLVREVLYGKCRVTNNRKDIVLGATIFCCGVLR